MNDRFFRDNQMEKQSIRFRIYPETKKKLEAIADEFNCIYGDKPNVSLLLIDIAEGRLKVYDSNIVQKEERTDFEVILELTVLTNLKGTIATITKTIGNCKGNIIKLEIELKKDNDSQETYSIIKVSLSIKKENFLKQLISDLQNLKIAAISPLNHHDELLLAMSKIKKKVDDNTYYDDFLSESLILKITGKIGLKINANDNVGVIGEVCYKVADEKMLISSVSQELCGNKNTVIIKLILSLKKAFPEHLKLTQQVNKIQIIKHKINELKNVNSVEFLKMDSLVVPTN